MNAVDRLALRWQFESFTKEFQDKYCNQMIREFVDAWRFKRNRSYIQKQINRFHDCRPDLYICQKFMTELFDKDPSKDQENHFDFFERDWSKYDVRKNKTTPYIGPDAFRQM